MKNYDKYQDGFSRGMLVMTEDLREVVDFLKYEENATREEIIEELERSINDILNLRIVARGVGITQEAYDLWANHSKVIRTETKYKLIGNLMDYED